jgi:hypothetical protein
VKLPKEEKKPPIESQPNRVEALLQVNAQFGLSFAYLTIRHQEWVVQSLLEWG